MSVPRLKQASELRLLVAGAAIAAVICPGVRAAPSPVSGELPDYSPQPYSIPKDASYVRPDGSIFIAGHLELDGAFARWNALFQKSHPEAKFHVWLKGSSTAIGGLAYGLIPFAPMGREIYLPQEKTTFRMVYGYDPVPIRVGRGSYSDVERSCPVAICVNKANPIEHLTTDEVARIFATGRPPGDIERWGQAGLKGTWAMERIHPLGPIRMKNDGLWLTTQQFGGFPFCDRYEEIVDPWNGDRGVTRVAQDPVGICISVLPVVTSAVKVVPIGTSPSGPFSTGSYEDVLSGKYPYVHFIYFYVNRAPGQPLDPFVKEYLRMVLSKEGQQALCDDAEGAHLPLTPEQLKAELAKLE
jgi:phosphate transport system substrate-binding protein